jgi:hypothetical protein
MVKSESERDVSGDEGLSVVVYIDQDVENILVGLREGRQDEEEAGEDQE